MENEAGEASVALVARITGRVQGVNFRAFVAAQACRLGVVGWCRNLPDWTTVEVYVEGRRAAIEQLVARLEQGPGLARVDDVVLKWCEPGNDPLEGFDVHW